MALDWSTFQKAIQDAIVSASGLADGKVIWARQNGTRPAAPYITLNLTPFTTIGIDGTRHTYNSGGASGAEITLTHGGMREFGLTVVAFGDGLGDGSAMAVIETLRAGLNKITVREALEAANVSFFDFGTVVDLTQVIDTGFEGRATTTLRGYTTQEVTETLGYIQTVEVEAVISNVTTVETVDIGSPPPSGIWGSGNVWGG